MTSDVFLPIDEGDDSAVTSVSSTVIRRADIAYVIDCTKSMDKTPGNSKGRNNIPLLSSLKACISELVQFYRDDKIKVRLGLTEFRDQNSPSDKNYGLEIMKHHEWGDSRFTSDLEDFKKKLDALVADGGGGPKESIYDALVATAEGDDWENGASRIIVLFTDTLPNPRDLVIKGYKEAIERIAASKINQLHLCIDRSQHLEEYSKFLNLPEDGTPHEITEIHDIRQGDMTKMTKFLRDVHKGSVARVKSSFRFSPRENRGKTRSQIPSNLPTKDEPVVPNKTLKKKRTRNRFKPKSRKVEEE